MRPVDVEAMVQMYNDTTVLLETTMCAPVGFRIGASYPGHTNAENGDHVTAA